MSSYEMILKRENPENTYRIVEQCGNGTYGIVYKAEHKARQWNNAPVALKSIKIEQGDDFGVIRQEIELLVKCRHPNIVTYHNSYIWRTAGLEKLWIAMEYCGGGSMQDIVQAIGPLSELHIAFVVREMLQGVEYLHRRSVIHRDIKGANILLDEQGDVKIVDFGVSTSKVDKAQTFIGTPYWMAPEVAGVEKKGGYDNSCDVWAIGITSIEFAEKTPPYYDINPMTLLVQMTQRNYKIPKLKTPQRFSKDFPKFLEQCLVKEPHKRASCSRLLEDKFVKQPGLGTHLTRQLISETRRQISNGHDRRLQQEVKPRLRKQLNSDDDLSDTIRAELKNRGIETPASPISAAHNRNGEVLAAILGDNSDTSKPQPPPRCSKYSKTVCRDNPDGKGVGMPPTPEVKMGACFTKVFQGCPLSITQTASWCHPETKAQFILVACSKGIYSLNVDKIYSEGEAEMELIHDRPCHWLCVVKNILMSISGSRRSIYRHDLLLSCSIPYRQSMDRLPSITKRLGAVSTKYPNTRGVLKCCVTSHRDVKTQPLRIYMCAAFAEKFVLYEWHEGLSKFVLDTEGRENMSVDIHGLLAPNPTVAELSRGVPIELACFDLLFYKPKGQDTSRMLICFGVRDVDKQSFTSNYEVAFDLYDCQLKEVMPVIPELTTANLKGKLKRLEKVTLSQLERNTFLVAYKHYVKVVTLQGILRQYDNDLKPLLEFPFPVESLVILHRSVIAFHTHGMEGQSFRKDEATQRILQSEREFKMLGNDRLVVLECNNTNDTTGLKDIYILTGHEDTIGDGDKPAPSKS